MTWHVEIDTRGERHQGVHNISRHSSSQREQCENYRPPKEWHMLPEVSDDGSGFDPATTRRIQRHDLPRRFDPVELGIPMSSQYDRQPEECGSMPAPERQRIHVLDRDAAIEKQRVRPSWALGHHVAAQRLEALRRCPRQNELTVVLQQKQRLAPDYHSGIVALPRLADPFRLPSRCLETE